MNYGSRESWTLWDRHMFETLETLLELRGPEARAASATAPAPGERPGHSFQACRPRQPDEHVGRDETRAVTSLGRGRREAGPETFPCGP